MEVFHNSCLVLTTRWGGLDNEALLCVNISVICTGLIIAATLTIHFLEGAEFAKR